VHDLTVLVFAADLGVNARRREEGVAELFLDEKWVVVKLSEVRGVTVTQAMEFQVGVETGSREKLLEALVQSVSVDKTATLGHE
jgi:hypothetical protein